MWSQFKKELDLSLTLAKINFILRNESSYLGTFWYLLNPLLMFLLLLFLFANQFGKTVENYPAYMLLGLIMFNFFQNSTLEAISAIINSGGLIRSINFSRNTLIYSIIFKNVIAHLFEIFIFIVFLIITKTSLVGLIYYPLILILLSLFTAGLSLLLSALAAYFVDLGNIWFFALRLIWLATPLFYSISNQSRLLIINLFNPMYYFITVAREIIVYSRLPDLWLIGGMIIYSFLTLIIGLIIFNKLKGKFAEII